MLYYGKNARKKTRRTVKQDKQPGQNRGISSVCEARQGNTEKKHRKVYHSGSLFLMNWTQQKVLKSSNNGQSTKRLYLCL